MLLPVLSRGCISLLGEEVLALASIELAAVRSVSQALSIVWTKSWRGASRAWPTLNDETENP